MRVTEKQRKEIEKFLNDYENFVKETGDKFQLAENASTYYAIIDV